MLDKTINNEFEQNAIDNGYKWFPDLWKHSLRGFQKAIRDDKGQIKYYINGYHYNHSKQLGVNGDVTDSYMFEVQFSKNERTIDVTYSATYLATEHKFDNLATLEEVEAFYEQMWQSMGFDYYGWDDE